jgi:N-acetylglucosaminyldiphosphoundecaprenol N-acetyl-beta-D-mannosaminyltransferase
MSPSIFGVRLDRIHSPEELLRRCDALLAEPMSHIVFTPNPEILLYAREHPAFADLLGRADLLLPDGAGIVLVQAFRRELPFRRWPGVDTAELLVGLAARRGLSVILVGGTGGAGNRAARCLRAAHPGLQIMAVGDGVPVGEDGVEGSAEDAARIEEAILRAAPSVVLVAFGAPKQERWIARHRSAFPSARVLMGVGGSFDMWAGRYRRAPAFVHRIGLEWVWRLVHQPSRLPRIWRATVVFPWHAVREPAQGGPPFRA